MQPKKHLSFSHLRKTISERALQIEDPCREGSVAHSIHDCCLSRFAMMFFQDPSMLAFQKRLQDDGHKNNIIIAGDDLYSNQPFIDELQSNRMSFILVAKPGDHKFLFKHLESVTHKIQTLELPDDNGRQHIYRWINAVPLNGTTRAQNVNFFDYTIKAAGKQTFIPVGSLTSQSIRTMSKPSLPVAAAALNISRPENQICFSRIRNPPGLLFPDFLIRNPAGSTPVNLMCFNLLSLL